MKFLVVVAVSLIAADIFQAKPITEEPLDIPCESPIITSFSGRVVHEIGSGHLKLRCKATGFPKPTIAWTPIKTERRFIDNNKGILTIKSPRPDDAGNYTCTASNNCGKDSIKTELILVCPELPALEQGDIEYEGDMSPGTVARFFCLPEHELFGPEFAVCLDNGEWNDTLPECLPLRQCPQPKNPLFGQVLYRQALYRPGQKATFSCKKGYKNVGSSYQVCQETLKWSRDKPICRKKRGSPISCGNPGDIENGIKSPNLKTYSVGTIVSYSCLAGSFIRGSASITCLSSGMWSSPPPTCEIILEDLDVLINRFSCVTSRCTCEEDYSGSGDLQKTIPINLIFVLDKSGSVSNADFRTSLQFVKETVNIFDKTCFSVYVSIVTYSKYAELETISTSPADLKDVLRNIRRRTYGPTATRHALDVVRDDIIMYNRSCYECIPPTERPPDKDFYTYPCPVCSKIIPTIIPSDDCGCTLLFLVTDGKSNWAGDPRAAAECLKANGAEVYAVGVTSHVNIAELRDIASEPLHSHLYLIQTFEDALKLVTLAKGRASVTC